MLRDPAQFVHPFAFFRCVPAFSSAVCADLEVLFDVEEGWQHRDEAFYRCFLRDCTDEVSPDLRAGLAGRMREITGLELDDRVEVTAQRMEPGQVIGTHSDQPLLGFEIARVVLQLNRGWHREDGGALELFADPEDPADTRVEPGYNEVFGFVLHPDSHHGVTEVSRERRTVVFNFWHVGNTPEVAADVRELFSDVHFSALPAALDAIATTAEETLPEAVTFRASLAAFALLKWGHDDRMIVSGYQFSAGLSVDLDPVVGRADFVARLFTEGFDLERWRVARNNDATKDA